MECHVSDQELMREGGLHYPLSYYFSKQNSLLYHPSESSCTTKTTYGVLKLKL